MVAFRDLFAIISKPMVVLFEEKEVILQVLIREVTSLGMYLFDVETTGIVRKSFSMGHICHKIFPQIYFYHNLLKNFFNHFFQELVINLHGTS